MQGAVGLLISTWVQIYQGIFQWKIFLIQLRFDRIMVMSLWPCFLAHPVALRWYLTINSNVFTRHKPVIDGRTDRQTDRLDKIRSNVYKLRDWLLAVPVLSRIGERLVALVTARLVIAGLRTSTLIGHWSGTCCWRCSSWRFADRLIYYSFKRNVFRLLTV